MWRRLAVSHSALRPPRSESNVKFSYAYEAGSYSLYIPPPQPCRLLIRPMSPDIAKVDDGSASIASRTRKKRKVEETEHALPETTVGPHHEDIWFSDGSIVIAAEGQAFKVHSTLLSRHSAVLGQHIDELSASEARETYDGCPVLRVDDEGDKLASLFNAIYDGGQSDVFHVYDRTVDIGYLCDLGPIAKKYEVNEVVNAIIDRLSRCFPSNKLEDWHPDLGNQLPIPPCYIEANDAVAVVALARILEAPKLLPTAFYTCILAYQANQLLAVSSSEDDPGLLLSRRDLGICLSGYEILLKQRKQMIKMFAEYAGDANRRSDQCKSSNWCHTACDKLLLKLLESDTLAAPKVIDPMDPWLNEQYHSTPQAKPCRNCDKVLRAEIKKTQRRIWKRLGSFFEVEPWPVTGLGPNEPAQQAPAEHIPNAA